MRNFTQLAWVLAAAAVLAAPASAGKLPATVAYTIYVDGVRVGYSRTAISRAPDAVRFDSRTRVELGPNVIELASRTVADPKTFAVREFSFEGTKGGMPTAMHAVLKGDSATGWVQSVASTERRPRSQTNPGGFIVFEDWIMDLEVALALRQAAAATPDHPTTYKLLFANSFLTADLLTGFTGDVMVESATRSLVGRKLEIIVSGGDPFESHVDPETGIPVYLRFPGSRTEVFRDDFFGDNPVPRYSGTTQGASER